ncbi:MAG: hypothetical protein R3Y29_07365, partial [bacterium]
MKKNLLSLLAVVSCISLTSISVFANAPQNVKPEVGFEQRLEQKAQKVEGFQKGALPDGLDLEALQARGGEKLAQREALTDDEKLALKNELKDGLEKVAGQVRGELTDEQLAELEAKKAEFEALTDEEKEALKCELKGG